jgi:ankyrin repeat protein
MALSSAGTTALGQTLLHIASLPMTSKCIDRENPNSVQSIHCARMLNSTRLSHQFPSPLHLDPNRWPGSWINTGNPVPKTTPLTTLEREDQLSTLRLLVEAGIDVGAQDVDGNTALHYLATTLNVDPRALQLLREMDGGEVYNSCKNQVGLTPRALWESGNEA